MIPLARFCSARFVGVSTGHCTDPGVTILAPWGPRVLTRDHSADVAPRRALIGEDFGQKLWESYMKTQTAIF